MRQDEKTIKSVKLNFAILMSINDLMVKKIGNLIMELCIGTAQFGTSYGVANDYRKVSRQKSLTILKHAARRGINYIDTASTYGDAEEIIGEISKTDTRFNILSKSPNFPKDKISADDAVILKDAAVNSVNTLGTSSLHAILVHHGWDLLKPGGALLYETLKDLKTKGIIGKIGVSVYDRAEIVSIIESFDIDIIQVPINCLDQRLLQDNILVDIKNSGIEIDVRSVFLQGILLMDPDDLPPFFNAALGKIKSLREDVLLSDLSPLDACIGFVKSLDFVSRVIVGVNSVDQLDDICSSFARDVPDIDYLKYSIHEENILNPSRWPV